MYRRARRWTERYRRMSRVASPRWQIRRGRSSRRRALRRRRRRCRGNCGFELSATRLRSARWTRRPA